MRKSFLLKLTMLLILQYHHDHSAHFDNLKATRRLYIYELKTTLFVTALQTL